MNWREIRDVILGVLSLVAIVLFVGWCSTSIVRDVHNAWVHRNEPIYLVSRMYDPIYHGVSVPASEICVSPARCEPSGKPNLRYFVVLREYEVRQVGLDPAHLVPYQE